MTTVWALVLLLVFRRPVNAQPLIIDGNSTNILPASASSSSYVPAPGDVDLELRVYGTGAVFSSNDHLLASVADAISDLLDAVDLYNIRLGNQSLVYIPQPNPRGLRHLLGLSGLALQGAGTAETGALRLLEDGQHGRQHSAAQHDASLGRQVQPHWPVMRQATAKAGSAAPPPYTSLLRRKLHQEADAPAPSPADVAKEEALQGQPALYLTFRLNFTSNAQQTEALNQLNSVLANLQLVGVIQHQERLNITFIELVSWIAVPFSESGPAPAAKLPKAQVLVPAREGLSRHAEIAIAASVPVTAIILMGLAAYGILHRRLKRQRRTADLENGMDPRLSGSSTESTRDSATSIAERGTKSKAFGLCGKWGAGDMQRSSSFEQVKAVAKVVQPANGQQAQQVKQAQQAGVAAQQQPRPSGDAGMENVIRRMDRPDTATEMLLMMPWSDWEIAPQELAICRRPDGSEWELGTGASGRVFKATRNGVQVVAIKIFQNVVVKSADHLLDQRQAIKKEVSILKSCHDRNIVQFIGACMQEGKTILVTEYLEGGDLHNALQKDHVGKLSWHRSPSGPRKSAPPLARRISLDIARGLHFLHSHKIVHFDLKSANILLGRDYTAKIADVGLAKILHDEFLSTLNNDVGTFAWAAPEVLLGNPCSEKVDIYSFGVVLWELTTGEEPRNRHLRAVRVPEECPAEVEAIMLRCRRENPAERPTAKELVDFFTDLLQAP